MTRDMLWQKLKERGIGTRKLYDKLTCDFKCYQDSGYVRKTDNADRIKETALDLPICGSLAEEDIEYVCEVIGKLKK